jgi:hypothetical protein
MLRKFKKKLGEFVNGIKMFPKFTSTIASNPFQNTNQFRRLDSSFFIFAIGILPVANKI